MEGQRPIDKFGKFCFLTFFALLFIAAVMLTAN